jgi:hypothetical protein
MEVHQFLKSVEITLSGDAISKLQKPDRRNEKCQLIAAGCL